MSDEDVQVKAIAVAWMRHLGYTDEQISLGERQGHENSGCEFQYPSCICEDEDGNSLHPESDELAIATEVANVALDAISVLTRKVEVTPNPERFDPELRADLIEFARDRIQAVWTDVPGGVDAATLASNVVAAQEFCWMSRQVPVENNTEQKGTKP